MPDAFVALLRIVSGVDRMCQINVALESIVTFRYGFTGGGPWADLVRGMRAWHRRVRRPSTSGNALIHGELSANRRLVKKSTKLPPFDLTLARPRR